MKKICLTAILILSTIIVGCSSTPMWRKVGVSAFDIQNIHAKCRYDVGLAKVSQNEKAEMVRECMMAQGFRYN